MDITGKLIAAMQTQSGVSQRSGNQWMKRDYVLEIPGQFPKHFVFTVFGEDRLKQFNLRKDETVTIQFDIDAHEYNGKWYNSCMAYNVVRGGESQRQGQQGAQVQPQAQQAVAQPAPALDAGQGGGGNADDLPF